MRRFIYTLLLGLLLVGCSKENQIDSSSELVAIDFVCDEITTRVGESDSYMFTLVGDGNSGKPLSDEYSYEEGKLTSTSKMLAANKATYRLVIASPATEMVAINTTTSAYGYKIERTSAEQIYINTTPISVAVWGITANGEYIHDLHSVTLHEQRSKVKVQFQVPENDSRTITKLYYSNLYDTAYTCPYSGVLYGNNKPNKNVYEFGAFSDGTGSKTYTNTESIVEPTVSGEGVTYFISGDYSSKECIHPKLCIGLMQDGEERLIEMGLNIKMEPMTTYTYDVKISSTELTVRIISTRVWDVVDEDEDDDYEGIGGEVGDEIGSYTINIATGVVSDWKPGCDENDGSGEIEKPATTAEIVTDYTNEKIYKSSNCYILNPSKNETMVYYIPVERINEFWRDPNYVANVTNDMLSSLGDNWEVVIFWHDFSGKSADAISRLAVEKSVSPRTGKVAVKVILPKEFYDSDNHCNVGYVVRRTDTKEVLWSWHLWITDYNPYKTPTADATRPGNVFKVGDKGELHRYNSDVFNGIYADKKIMDRNLGARSAGSDTQEYLGVLYYQYGRKDPFPRVALYANGYFYSTDGSSSMQQSFEYAVNNPEKFIIKSGNWCNSDVAQSPSYIWNDHNINVADYKTGKSIFDPSPLGFRVPVDGTWSDFGSNFIWNDKNNIGRIYDNYALYPVMGYKASNTGSCCYDTNGYNWSATSVSDINGYNFSFGPKFCTKSSNSNRACGYCVRPVEE